MAERSWSLRLGRLRVSLFGSVYLVPKPLKTVSRKLPVVDWDALSKMARDSMRDHMHATFSANLAIISVLRRSALKERLIRAREDRIFEGPPFGRPHRPLTALKGCEELVRHGHVPEFLPLRTQPTREAYYREHQRQRYARRKKAIREARELDRDLEFRPDHYIVGCDPAV